MARGPDHLRREPGRLELPGEPRSRRLRVAIVLGFRADRGDAQEVVELGAEAVEVLLDVGQRVRQRPQRYTKVMAAAKTTAPAIPPTLSDSGS